MLKTCPICGEPAELNGRQKQCAKCSNILYWERYNKTYGTIPLEESQKKILTTHAGLEVLNNVMGQFMAIGDKTDKEIYFNKVLSKKEATRISNQKQRERRKALKEEFNIPEINEDEE